MALRALVSTATASRSFSLLLASRRTFATTTARYVPLLRFRPLLALSDNEVEDGGEVRGFGLRGTPSELRKSTLSSLEPPRKTAYFERSTSQVNLQSRRLSYTGFSEVSSFRVQSALVSMRPFSTGTGNFPVISDPDVKAAFKELMAWGWDDIPDSVISDAKKAIAKSTEDKAGQRALSDVFRAAEASEEFTAILVNIRMGLEERTGLTGEDVTELPEELANAIAVAYNRYIAYVNSFGPDETYLRKKVEAELGTRLIHMKQRVSGLGSEWGDINVIGTSGLSGSYVEQRSL